MTRFFEVLSAQGSLRKKFSLALLAALVLVFPPIMIAVDMTARWSIEKEISIERSMDLKVHAAAVSKPLYDFDYANLQRMASIIATAEDIDRVQIEDAGGVVVAASAESRAKQSDGGVEVSIIRSEGVDEERIGALRLWFNTDRATRAIRDFYWRTGLVITLSLAVVFIALMMTLRQVMLRPLSALMKAIEHSRSGGVRSLAEWRSGDEMGRLVDHFNAMQSLLHAEQVKLKAANANLSTLYHQTPAMLFSLDEDGLIADVSDYWMQETGYRREETIGRPLSDFLENDECGPSGAATDRKGATSECGSFARWNCRFLKKSGEFVDVYVSETIEPLRMGERQRSLLVMVDISELKQAEAELLRRSRTDSLTGLPNRRHFKECLTEELQDAELAGARLDVFFIDLDRFKWVNDHLGHQAGDEVLNRSAARMQEVLPHGAFFARLGGDEFAVFHRGGSPEIAAEMSRSVNAALSQPFVVCGSKVSISASIGVATYPENATSVGGLLRAADLAMYRTKRLGRRGFSNYDESIGAEARRLFEVEEMMNKGALDDRFHLDFQPIVNLSDQRIIGAEALLRMRDDAGRVVPPNDFIPVAEECGRMPELGAFALRRASQDFAAALANQGAPKLRLSVNLSPVQVCDDLPDRVAETLERTGFPPRQMILEITESVFLKQDVRLLSVFERLRGLGCRLALDDFGTGYSSLSYLNDFPVDVVKIDRQFIRRLDGDGGQNLDQTQQKRARSLLQGVAAIAQELDFQTVAEGVETEAQRRLVNEMGFDFGQGYLWSKPVSPQRFSELLAEQDAAETATTLLSAV